MSIVRIAIPLLKGKRRFHIDKGRPWSVVEHAMLAAVAQEPRTVGMLSVASRLPRRLVLEMLIRLMRAGWVVLDQRPSGVIFSASPAGLSIADHDELPIVSKRVAPLINFVIDRITGTLYRSRELPYYEEHVLRDRATRERIVWMEPRPAPMHGDPESLVSTLLEDDEKFIRIDPAGDRLVDRYALVTVRNGILDGLPKRAPAELSRLVLEAAAEAPEFPAADDSPHYEPPAPQPYEERDLPPLVKAAFRLDDIIVGAAEHRTLLHSAIRRAQHRLIIHSTFISPDKFSLVQPLIYEAAKRGVIVDILWGEDDQKSDSRATTMTVRKLRQDADAAGLRSALRIHSFSTRSHAKILVFDTGSMDKLVAAVGSCNWLSSGFHSFEASIRLVDPRMVAGVLDQLAALTLGSEGHWTELTSDFLRLSADAKRQPLPSGPRAEMRIVLGPAHGRYVRLARDTAASRLFVTSHRLGAANRPAVTVPAIAAAKDRGVQATVYFGIPFTPYTRGDAAQLSASVAPQGVNIQSVQEPRLHAKVLAWDNDHLLVTSQNWLSADPTEGNPLREIGIYLHAENAALTLIDRFESLRRIPSVPVESTDPRPTRAAT